MLSSEGYLEASEKEASQISCLMVSISMVYDNTLDSKLANQFFQKVEQEYRKNFDFLKQHALSHMFQDI